MLSFSIALVLVAPQSNIQTPAVQNMGKLGTWYWRNPGTSVPLDEEDQAPTLEKQGDSYKANVKRLARASAQIRNGRYTSYQVNVDSQRLNIVGDAANEPSLTVDPTNRDHIAVGWRQFDNVTSNFRQAGNGYSLDGGIIWRNHQVFTPGTFRSDPVLVSDSQGKIFYNSLQQTFFTDIFESSNAGIDYLLKGPATGGDKQWMACDQTTSVGQGFLYQAWSTAGNNYNGRQFSRSTNGGTSWLNPINIPGQPIWGTLDVARNGDLYMCGMANTNFSFLRSTNAKIAAQTPTFDRNVNVNLGGAIVYGSTINPAGLLGQCWIATDKSTGPNAGNIYMLCSVGVDTTNPCQVNFRRSTDGGLTWSPIQTINTDPLNQGASHWFGTLAVAPTGRVDVCWYDNRANPTISNSALFMSSSYDGGVTWTPNVQLSPYFNPNIGYPNQNKMGDYMGMVSDSRSSNIAYAATFNNEQDIWFLRVPAAIGFKANATSVSTFQGKYVSGGLSSILDADGTMYSINSAVISGLGSVAAPETYHNIPVTDVGGLAVKVRATTSMSTTAMVWLWNWTTQKYEFKKSLAWPGGSPNESTFTFDSAVEPYIYGNGNVRCLVRFLDPARLGSRSFNAQIDQIQLLY